VEPAVGVLLAGAQLEPYQASHGPGQAIIDGRAARLTAADADRGFARAVGQARAHGQSLPASVRIILGGGSSRYRYYP
jgi:hypothetical protein